MIKKLNHTNILVGIVYFLQGFSLSGLAFSLFLKETLHWSMMQMSLLGVITSLPWFGKIVFGMVSDNFPLFGYRRKSYIVVSSIAISCAWIILSLFHSTWFWFYASIFFLMSFCSCFTDVLIDGTIVEKSKTEKESKLYQNICWGTRAFGGCISGFASGWLAQHVNLYYIFAMQIPISLILLPFVFKLKERKYIISQYIEKKELIKKSLIEPCKEFIRNKQLLWISLFILLCAFSPSLGTPLFFRYRDLLHFSPQFLGILGTVGSVGDIIGCILFVKFFGKVDLKDLLKFAIGIWALNTFLVLFITNETSAVVIALCSSILGYIAFIPLLSISARICNSTKQEATLFAIVCSLNNISGQVSSLFGTWLIKFVSFETLVWISTFTTFIVIPLIPKVCRKEK